MSWWDMVYKSVNVGDELYTPGRGMDGGNRRKLFTIYSKEPLKIVVHSGDSNVPLIKECFEVVEEALMSRKYRCLRVASIRDKEALDGSADKLIRQATNSNLARGNYVCSILEHCELVRYDMQDNKKVIKRSDFVVEDD